MQTFSKGGFWKKEKESFKRQHMKIHSYSTYWEGIFTAVENTELGIHFGGVLKVFLVFLVLMLLLFIFWVQVIQV
jgi:hypothetical protein